MRLLLDSHVFLWLAFQPERLSAGALRQLASADDVAISVASLWELALKHAKGKLVYSPELLQAERANAHLFLLPIEPNHLNHLQTIRLPHADPFDTLLVAQAVSDGRSLMTADKLLLASAYPTIAA